MSDDGRNGTVGWIFNPWFDMLFLANLLWPVVYFLALMGDGFDGHAGIRFWQIYFVTTPHRWITILIVFLDRDRLGQRPFLFTGLALLAIVACVTTRFTTGTLTCLLAIDYIWNAWHFAAQHHGIYRWYGRISGPATGVWSGIEKFLLRLFLLYVIGRVAGGTWSLPTLDAWLKCVDWFVCLIPVTLLAVDLTKPVTGRFGRILYLSSLSLLYLSLLWAVHVNRPRDALALTTAAALFHATEYLAVVSSTVQQRRQKLGSDLGWLYWFASRWGLTLLIWICALGVGGWFIEQQWLEEWLMLNLILAFLHYAYDGVIWRRSKSTS